MGKTASTGTRNSGYQSEAERNADTAAFEQIIRIAEAASHGEEYGQATDDRGGRGPSASGCQIKALPERLLSKAADVAGRINPANAAQLQMALPQGVHVDSPQRLTVLNSNYWGPKPREFTVSFMESTPADLRARIVSHMNAWSRTANKTFVETSGTGEIRISRGAGGYYSYLGTDVALIPPSEQTMNLEGFTMQTDESEFRRVVRHETGHTLGFPHEHMRQDLVARIDREKAYEYFRRTQGWDSQTVDQQVLTSLDERSVLGTPADDTSIMCYQLPGSITVDGQDIKGGKDINTTDALFAGLIYPTTFTAQSTTAAHQRDWGPSLDVDARDVVRNFRV